MNESLLARLKAGTANTKILDWPGTNEKVALRILSQQQLQEAAFETERIFKAAKIEIHMLTADEYQNEKATQILYRALRLPSNMTEPIGTVTEFKSTLSLTEKEYLIKAYNEFEKECSPNPDHLSDVEFDRIVQAVKKNPSMIVGSSYSTDLLKKLITVLASQPAT